MSFSRIDSSAVGSYGSLPLQQGALPQVEPFPAGKVNAFDFTGRASSSSLAGNKSFLHQWSNKAAIWGSQDVAANFVNKQGKSLGNIPVTRNFIEKYGINNITQAADGAKQLHSYSDILHLKNNKIAMKDLSWSKYAETVKGNTRGFMTAIKPTEVKGFFYDTTAKKYMKETLIKGNTQPVKELFSNNPNKEIGSGLFRLGAGVLTGYDVLKHTRDAYRTAKAQEDGSFKSRLHTYKETGVAFTKYVIRDAATWEAAGFGAAIGRAVIPLALGGLPIGGIAIGALVGLAAQRVLDSALKTGSKDPVQQQKNKHPNTKY